MRRNSYVLRGNFEGIAARSVLVASKRGFDFYRDRTDIRDGRLISGPSCPIIRTVLNRSASEGRGYSTAIRTAIIRAGISGSGDGQFLVIGCNFQRTGLVGDGIVFCQRVVFQRIARNRIRAGTNCRLTTRYSHARKALIVNERTLGDLVAVSRQRSAVILLGSGVSRQFNLNRRDRQRAFNLVDVIVGRICTSVQCILKSVFCRFGTDIRRRAGDVIRCALASNKTIAANGDFIVRQRSAIIFFGSRRGGQGHIAFGDLNGVLGIFCLIAFLLSCDLDINLANLRESRFCRRCRCPVTVLILGLVGQRCAIGICHFAAMRTAVIFVGIARSGKRQRLGRDLTCGDGEVDRTALDCQCGLAVQGHVAVLISHSGLGIDGDGVGLCIGVNSLADFSHSCCTREFPLICTVFRGETIGGAVLKRHTGREPVGHSTAVQTADDGVGDGRKNSIQLIGCFCCFSVVGISCDFCCKVPVNRSVPVSPTFPVPTIFHFFAHCAEADSVKLNRLAF